MPPDPYAGLDLESLGLRTHPEHGRAELLRGPEDPEKAEAAQVFKAAWDAVEKVGAYAEWRARHRSEHG